MNEQRNLILACVLAMAVLLGFNFFYDAPRQQQQTQTKLASQVEKPSLPSPKITQEVALEPLPSPVSQQAH